MPPIWDIPITSSENWENALQKYPKLDDLLRNIKIWELDVIRKSELKKLTHKYNDLWNEKTIMSLESQIPVGLCMLHTPSNDTWKMKTIKDYDKNDITIKLSPKDDVFPEGSIIEFVDWPYKGKQLYCDYDVFCYYACEYIQCPWDVLEHFFVPSMSKIESILWQPWSEECEQKTNTLFSSEMNVWYYIPRDEKIGRQGDRCMIRSIWWHDIEIANKKYSETIGWNHYGFLWVLMKYNQ